MGYILLVALIVLVLALGISTYLRIKGIKLPIPKLPKLSTEAFPWGVIFRALIFALVLLVLATEFPQSAEDISEWSSRQKTPVKILVIVANLVLSWWVIKNWIRLIASCLVLTAILLLVNKEAFWEAFGRTEELMIVVTKRDGGSLIYQGPTPWEGGAEFPVHIEVSCLSAQKEKSVSVSCMDWGNQKVILRACSLGKVRFPNRTLGTPLVVKAEKN